MDAQTLKDSVQDCHLNFLIGSGLSMPYLRTLGNIEILLTELENANLGQKEREIINSSILGEFFSTVIEKNPDILDDSCTDTHRATVLANYKQLVNTLGLILLKRKSSILNKQINLFTTNIDLFLEKALEDTQLEFNDGFSGRINPVFSLTNFKKSFFKRSSHYDISSEIPAFNLLKVHGSLSWKTANDRIVLSRLEDITAIKKKWDAVKSNAIRFDSSNGLQHFIDNVSGITHEVGHTEFLQAYSKLSIVNPTKHKFRDTILNLNYYELLRLFSNELEKENSLLFILGFSIADEHIREIILRAANSNPTLLILVYAYDKNSKSAIEDNIKKGNVELKYNNLKVLEPEDGKVFDLASINADVFYSLLKQIDKS